MNWIASTSCASGLAQRGAPEFEAGDDPTEAVAGAGLLRQGVQELAEPIDGDRQVGYLDHTVERKGDGLGYHAPQSTDGVLADTSTSNHGKQ